MPLDTTLPRDAAGEGDALPELNTEEAAIAALDGLLGGAPAPRPEREAETTESDASASDAGQEETPATGDEEGQSEPEATEEPAAPAIEPPASWSAEEKADFAKLPPELQATVARRESERDKLITQRTQEIAEHRKAAEAERAAIASERDTYARSLQQLMALAVPEADQLAGIDWQKLATEQPAEYVRLSAQRDALRNRVGALQAEMQRVQEQAQADQAKRFSEVRAEQARLLVEKIPDFADAVKAEKLTADLRSYLASEGYAPEEVAQLVDHRAAIVARKAMLYDRAEAARKAAEAKRAATPAPVVQKPGTPAPATSAQKQRQEKWSRLARSGGERDAIAVLMDFL